MVNRHTGRFIRRRNPRECNYDITTFHRLHFIAVLILQCHINCRSIYNFLIFFYCIRNYAFYLAGRNIFRHYLSSFRKDTFHCFHSNGHTTCFCNTFKYRIVYFFYKGNFNFRFPFNCHCICGNI